jgi:biopolymer transport protein ExbB
MERLRGVVENLLYPELQAYGSEERTRLLRHDVLVQAVMLGLTFSSVVTWTVWLAKGIELKRAVRKLRAQTLVLADQRALAEAPQHLRPGCGVMQAFVRAAEAELELSSDLFPRPETRRLEAVKKCVRTRFSRAYFAP